MSELPTLDDLLMGHAAGRLPEPVSLFVACHLALAPDSRRRYRRYEAIGGVLLEGIVPEPVATGDWDRLVARLEDGDLEADVPPPAGLDGRLPRPLARYVGGRLDTLSWRSVGPLTETDLPCRSPRHRIRLIRLRAGRASPRHTHDGTELTLVLDGGFRDSTGHYLKGDIEIADGQIDHRPTADPDEDCLCLAVTDAPLRLTGPLGRLLNPFVRA